jgi:integrase/recombinase XerD
MPEYQRYLSVLSIPIEGYIAEKQAVGYSFKKRTNMLKSFDSFVHSHCLTETVLTKQLVMDWTARKPNETVSTQCGRISLLRGLAEYMIRVGYSAYVYPKAMVTINRYTYIPYIFSSDEMKRLFEVCDPAFDLTAITSDALRMRSPDFRGGATDPPRY